MPHAATRALTSGNSGSIETEYGGGESKGREGSVHGRFEIFEGRQRRLRQRAYCEESGDPLALCGELVARRTGVTEVGVGRTRVMDSGISWSSVDRGSGASAGWRGHAELKTCDSTLESAKGLAQFLVLEAMLGIGLVMGKLGSTYRFEPELNRTEREVQVQGSGSGFDQVFLNRTEPRTGFALWTYYGFMAWCRHSE
ncbi:hypothetical protein B0H10DRAFT_1940689 [Mycena sp. CBHHK59/15]|nr:hypothetical protein B0H10DRAFT_1940689 [Mycena sp. CBHHK59/15]